VALSADGPSLASRIQVLLDGGDGWGLASLLREELGGALRTHVAGKLAGERLPASWGDEVCAAVWRAVDERLERRPIPWTADLGIAYLCGIANHKIADLGRQALRVAGGGDGDLLDRIAGPTGRQPDRELSSEDRRRALDEVMSRLDRASRELIDLHYGDGAKVAAIVERVEREPDLAAALGLAERREAIRALPDVDARQAALAELAAHLSTRIYRAKKRLRRLVAEHPLLAQYALDPAVKE
jgi:DNA-directed RNA polymerase specialized sigma24 family protein